MLQTPANPPLVELDANYYKLIDQLDQSLAGGIPSMKRCRELAVSGPVLFNAATVLDGKVSVINPQSSPKPLPAGEYKDTAIIL